MDEQQKMAGSEDLLIGQISYEELVSELRI